MRNLKLFLIMGLILCHQKSFSENSKAEKTDVAEDSVFGDLPDSKATATPKTSEEVETVDASIEKKTAEKTPEASAPDEDKAPEEISEKLLTPKADELPAEILELETRFKKAERDALEKPGSKLVEVEGLDEPGRDLEPSDKFERIPLRPPMSDKNWIAWAGVQHEKIYKIKKRNSLWSVSETLFGNSHLWPKVWQLNAGIENPHELEPGIQLYFNPGGLHAAPQLSVKGPFKKEERLPMVSLSKSLTPDQIIELRLKEQFTSKETPFKFFLLDTMPAINARLSKAQEGKQLFYSEGDEFPLQLQDGEYSIVRITNISTNKVSAYRTRWVGMLSAKSGQAKIERAFAEVSEGDLVVSKRFEMSGKLQIAHSELDQEEREKTYFLPLHEGYSTVQAENMVLGVRFSSIEGGVDPGSILNIKDKMGKNVGSMVIVHRDGAVGTGWVIRSTREISTEDLIF